MDKYTGLPPLEETTPAGKYYDTRGYSLAYPQATPNPENSKLSISPLRLGKASLLRPSQRDTVEEEGVLYKGLAEYIRTTPKDSEAPCYIFDNHNLAFYAWCEALVEKRIKPGATLIHIDTHGDDTTYQAPLKINPRNLSEVKDLTSKLQIYNFIDPALKLDVIKDIIWISPFHQHDETTTLPRRENDIPLVKIGMDNPLLQRVISSTNLIVDVDLDYFQVYITDPGYLAECRNSSNIQATRKSDMEKIRELMHHASLVTMATSPSAYFKQSDAITIAKQLAK